MGDNEAVMCTFHDNNTLNSGAVLFEMAHNAGLNTPRAYIGMFHWLDEECGCSLILHGWKTYLTMLGCPTNWDGKILCLCSGCGGW